ncbi:MAG: 50S ribosomal protein L11 methyltransferase [Gammaproteobacteria bacterium]|nr:50S ribosomal protein L11 methyltransferase [Gammaproteobacteria bacterium]
MPWLKISFTVSRDSVDIISQELQEAGAIATSLFSADREEVLETSLATSALWSQVRMEALLHIGDDTQSIRNSLNVHSARNLSVGFVEEREWENEWRKELTCKKFGRLQILPRESHFDVEEPVVRIDPGLAFGTGEHATTALCLDWLESMDLEGKSVLDFGCGSGILGIAASKLGAFPVEAIDHDERAVEATLENASFNEAKLTVNKSIASNRKFDVVVANILLNTLVEYANDLTNSVARDGVLGLTGLLSTQQEAIVVAYPLMCFEQTLRREDWILMVGRKSHHDI